MTTAGADRTEKVAATVDDHLHLVWITNSTDGTEHAVDDKQHSAGLVRGDGLFDAICARRLTAAALTVEPDVRCALCVRALHRGRSPESRRSKRSTLRRLTNWLMRRRSSESIGDV